VQHGALVHVGAEIEQQPHDFEMAVIDRKAEQPAPRQWISRRTPGLAATNSRMRGASANATAARMVTSAPRSSSRRATAGNRSAPWLRGSAASAARSSGVKPLRSAARAVPQMEALRSPNRLGATLNDAEVAENQQHRGMSGLRAGTQKAG
jgi:hypothetical protein